MGVPPPPIPRLIPMTHTNPRPSGNPPTCRPDGQTRASRETDEQKARRKAEKELDEFLRTPTDDK